MKLSRLLLIAGLAFTQNTFAQVAPGWGNAVSFAALAGNSIVDRGGTYVLSSNMGVYPGTVLPNFNYKLNGSIFIPNNGTWYMSTGVRIPMESATAAYNSLKTQPGPTTELSGKILGQSSGATILEPGIYTFKDAAHISGTLELDDKGNPNAVFIFRIGTTLTATSSSKVTMKTGGNGFGIGPNVFWQVGSTADIRYITGFVGNIIATSDINILGVSVFGRAFSLNGTVFIGSTYLQATLPTIPDADGDGLADALDEYPSDGRLAHNNYSTTTTAAFEDQWPIKGDFDLNDVVVSYKYNVITDAINKVSKVVGDFTLKARGGDIKNGFAVEFPVAANKTANLTGGTLEANQTNAVVILFNNMHTEMATGNTVPGQPVSPDKTYHIEFDVNSGQTLSEFGTDFNPFIFSGSPTRIEVHLPGKTPTQLADLSLFGTGDDASSVAHGLYYKTKTGLPYALSFPGTSFSYPAEGKDVSLAYPNFVQWALSGGTLFTDWFSNTAAGYRNSSLIYSK